MSPAGRRAAPLGATSLALLLALLAAGAWSCGGGAADRGARSNAAGQQTAAANPPADADASANPPEDAGAAAGEAGPDLPMERVTLYFAHADGVMLAPDRKEIYRLSSDLDRMKQTVVALIEGPTEESGLRPVLPPGISLRDLYLDPRGVVYADFGPELVQSLPAGSAGELLATQALAHTLATNFPDVNAVQILVMGEEIETLTGHLDTTRPIRPDARLVRLPEEGQT